MDEKNIPEDEKNNPENAQKSDGWQKTISDSPVPDIDKLINDPLQSAYAIAPKPEGVNGEHLGSGQIVGFLGEGGMARVYKIWNEALEMHRAVKVLIPSGKKEVSDRFLTEARITARLNHPNIISVFALDKWKGYPFIEMEYIDGVSLDKLLESRGSFPAYVSCAIGILIANALSYAHIQEYTLYGKPYKGVIHRDLKPSNIMLEHNGKLKLMDFGIARPLSTGLHTMDGNIVGTLPYLSPEQLNNEKVDQRTDIYAVGAILYELLCGSKAFPDERLTELVNKKESGVYIKFGDIPVSVPPKLAEIVDTCLNVDQNKRYPDADALADAFRIAYDRCTGERPEIALKKFLENPNYSPPLPVLTVKDKKGRSLPGQSKKISMPEPKPPEPCRPPLRLPKEHVLKPGRFFIRMLRDAFAGVTRLVGKICKAPGRAFATMATMHVPGVAYGIAMAVFGGIAMTILLVHVVPRHPDITKRENAVTANENIVPDNKNPDSLTKPIVAMDPPEIIKPAINEILKTDTVTVLWHPVPAADSFTILVATTGEFTDTIYRQTLSTDTTVAITGLKPGTFFCRLGAIGKGGVCFWSASRSFRLSPATPDTLKLVSPPDGKRCIPGAITFLWEKVQNARSYRITIANNSNFDRLIFDSSGCWNTITLLFSDTAMAPYFWRVRAEKERGDWSSTYSFVIAPERTARVPQSDSISVPSENPKVPASSSMPADSLKTSTKYYEIAVRAMKNNDAAKALDAIANMYDKDSRKLELQFEFTEKCLEVKDLENARRCILKIKSENARVFLLRGRLLYAKNRVEQALDEYAKAMNLCIGTPDAPTIKSEILFCQAECYEMIFRKTPDDKNYQKAKSFWNRVLQNELLKQKHYFAKYRLENLKNSQATTREPASPPK